MAKLKKIGRHHKIMWPHQVTDNTWDDHWEKYLNKTFEAGKKKVIEGFPKQLNEDGSFKPGHTELRGKRGAVNGEVIEEFEDLPINHISFYVPFCAPAEGRWSEVIDDLFCHAWDIGSISETEYMSSCYMSFIQLNIIPSGFSYGWHLDATYKYISSVTYWGEDGEGTILKSNHNQAQIEWKHNRAFWFVRSPLGMELKDPLLSKELLNKVYEDDTYPFHEPCNEQLTWHKYVNTKSAFRYSVNMFMINQTDALGLMGLDDHLPGDINPRPKPVSFGEWLIWNIPDQSLAKKNGEI
jgi:hypothetical protein